MAPLKQTSRLAARYTSYYYSGRSDNYYKNKIIIACVCVGAFIILSAICLFLHDKKKKKRRAALANAVLPYGPGGAPSGGAVGIIPYMAPPPYTGPVGQEPKWNGTQWQGPNNEDGTPGPCWNGLQWVATPGPVWNGVTWVQGGPVNGVTVPMSENGRVWNGTAWVGPYDAQVLGQGNVAQGQVQGQENGVTVPPPVYAQNADERRDSLRTNGVNADGRMGHAATQSRDFGDANTAKTVTPEVKEVKEKGWKAWLKRETGA